jgi:hypothetical protein
MSPITLEAIDAKQVELNLLTAEFKEQANRTTVHTFAQVDITLRPGDHYAGPVFDETGKLLHHLVLRAERPAKKLNWQAANEWAAAMGATLPTRQEQALLYANCKPHLGPSWHWSCEEYADDASFAWFCGFDDGYQDDTRKSYEGSVVAVRRSTPVSAAGAGLPRLPHHPAQNRARGP